MASMTLKDIPDDLLRGLRKAAARDRRSLNQEVQHLLALVLKERPEQRPAPSPDVKAQLAAWRRLAGQWRSDATPEEEAREVVRRRTRGRKVEL